MKINMNSYEFETTLECRDSNGVLRGIVQRDGGSTRIRSGNGGVGGTTVLGNGMLLLFFFYFF